MPPVIRSYSAASNIEIAESPLPVESLRAALRDDPSRIVSLRRRQYEDWWSAAMRVQDPLQRGAVLGRLFSPQIARAIARLVDDFRADLIGVVERDSASAYVGWAADGRVARLLGPPGDLRNLGVQTQRAVGREQLRNVWVHGTVPRHCNLAAADLAPHFGHAVAPQPIVSAVDRWGCMGLVVDELAIGFRGGSAGLMCVDKDGRVCVWEGADRSGPVADSGATTP
jgi:hypothetical protein